MFLGFYGFMLFLSKALKHIIPQKQYFNCHTRPGLLKWILSERVGHSQCRSVDSIGGSCVMVLECVELLILCEGRWLYLLTFIHWTAWEDYVEILISLLMYLIIGTLWNHWLWTKVDIATSMLLQWKFEKCFCSPFLLIDRTFKLLCFSCYGMMQSFASGHAFVLSPIQVHSLSQLAVAQMFDNGRGMTRSLYLWALRRPTLNAPLVGERFSSTQMIKWVDKQVVNCLSKELNFSSSSSLPMLWRLLNLACKYYGNLWPQSSSITSLVQNKNYLSSKSKNRWET